MEECLWATQKAGVMTPEQRGEGVNKFIVRCYIATILSIFTQADHFEDYTFESLQDLETFAKRFAKTGFQVKNKWIMPGSIMSITQVMKSTTGA